MSGDSINPETGEVVETPPEQVAAARPRSANIRRALLLAQRAVRGVGKGDEAKVYKDGKLVYTYKFASSEDMVESCRTALLEVGLLWELVGWEVIDPASRPADARDRRASSLPTLIGHFELTHAESGDVEPRDYPMPIASRNDADKALAGAITYLIGQSLRALLMVPRVSEADAANDPDRRDAPARGWHSDEPRAGQRRIVREDDGPRDELTPTGETTDALKGDIRRLSGELQKLKRGMSLQIFRAEAGVPQSGILSRADLCTLKGWLERELASEKHKAREASRKVRQDPDDPDALPEWAEPTAPGTLGDGLDQRTDEERQRPLLPDPTDTPPSERFRYPQRNGRASR